MSERRRYPRVEAEILYRPAGLEIFHHRRNTKDVSLDGMRVYSDRPFSPGTRLDLEVFLPDGGVVRCWAEVVWVTRLDDDSPAGFDVGMRFTDMNSADVQRLASVLSRGT